MLAPTDKLTLTARVLTAVWAGLLMVEFAVWLVICLVSGALESPWWLWTAAIGGVVVGGFWLVVRGNRNGDGENRS
jgi:membrane associated rhomboid family serine protease